MPKYITIDAYNHEVNEVTGYLDLDVLRNAVGGFICLGHFWRQTGDTLYVDDEGRLKNIKHGFQLLDSIEPYYIGNGIIVGKEVETKTSWYNEDVKLTLEQIRERILFIDFQIL